MAEKLNVDEVSALRHWAHFGQPGRASLQRVTASAWETESFTKPERVPWSVPIPAEKVEALLNGFQPEEMEDKWFVYADGPDGDGLAKLHMYRSWTGFEMAELDIRMSGDGSGGGGEPKAEITAIKFETDRERIGDQDEKSAKNTALTVCKWVLGVILEDKS